MSTRAAHIANTILHAKRPLTSALIAERTGESAKKVAAVCNNLRRFGWLVCETRPGHNTTRLRHWWRPSAKLRQRGYQGQPHEGAVEARILAAIDAGYTDRASLYAETGISKRVMSYGLERLVKKGLIERTALGCYNRPLDEDEDTHWTPQPYVHPYRAKALGLTR